VRSYCVGGPAFAPHVVAQVRLAPQARIVLDLALGVGSYKVRALQLPDAFPLQISNAAHGHRGRVQFSPAAPPLDGRELLGPGVQNLEIVNQTERELVVRVERSAPREDALTAARAACLASFRKLFPGEVLASGRLVAVGRPAFMVCSVYHQRQLMSELGDARAFEQILTHLQWIEDATVAEGGAMVKTASGATLCAFDSASAAVRAAMALRARLDHALTQPGTLRPLDIRIIAHQGPAVAATLDGRLDYFGHTVESALDLVAHAPPGRVLLSEALAEDQNALADLTSAGHGLELMQLGAHGGDCLLARAQLEDAA
jgi:class 3 adenylate cyclase